MLHPAFSGEAGVHSFRLWRIVSFAGNTTMTTSKNFFRNALAAFISARERQADRYVNGALLMLDDETLKAHGYSRAELRKRPHSIHTF